MNFETTTDAEKICSDHCIDAEAVVMVGNLTYFIQLNCGAKVR